MESLSPQLIAVFFAAALLYASVGHGGASAYLPILILAGFAREMVVPTVLILNILVSLWGSFHYHRAGHLDFRLLGPFVCASIPAAFLGGDDGDTGCGLFGHFRACPAGGGPAVYFSFDTTVLGIEWIRSRRFSWLLQFELYTSPFHGTDVDVLDRGAFETAFGFDYALRPHVLWQLYVIENFNMPFIGASADFTLLTTVSYRF